jgi:hypothetical protein
MGGKEGVMPKEVVYDQTGMWNVHVGWSPSEVVEADMGSVQVGIETGSGVPLIEQLWAQRPADLKVETVEHPEGYPPFRGVWGTYDRAGLNRLIRTLRRARDQAYGADA